MSKIFTSHELDKSNNFCMTLSLGKSPEEVINIYGADAGEARWLTADAPGAYVTNATTTVLRAGSLGDWTFCLEFEYLLGSNEGIMRELSTNAEAIVIFRTAKALTGFHYVANCELLESFEPGYPPSVSGRSSHEFSSKVHALTSTGLDPVAACLEVVTGHVGCDLTKETLRGPLLSVIMDKPDLVAFARRDPLLLRPAVPQKSRRRLGRRL
ncbi:DUF6461 domain-containing protein [Streptomyces sp. NPDC102441]|uniref:DUF6461 domain-containing protein n=1 Tax=Streptomyces sp. NPDC102441 TaxID=3366176 RepID=UPI00382DF7D6